MSRFQIRLVGAIAGLMLMGASAVLAQFGEPFGGSYSLSQVSESSGAVALELTLTVTNNSGREVHYGVLRILGEGDESEPVAIFEDISMPFGGSVRFSEGVLLTASQYASWAGGGLEAVIEAFDENSSRHEETVRLAFESHD